MRLSVSILVSALCSLASAVYVAAFEQHTHILINENAAQIARISTESAFDDFLRSSIGLVQGLQTPFQDRNGTRNPNGNVTSALDWLRLGAVHEDVPLCRTARHFHDPLEPWSTAGLTTIVPLISVICGGVSFPSSIVWGQDPNQQVGGQRSWFDARTRYWDALTATTQETRDEAWATTLEALGQLMHLVADASVPEHVRNDTHLLESALRTVRLRGYGSYEWWVEDNRAAVPVSGVPPFDRAILRQATNNDLAPIAIARLIDTDRYTGTVSGPGVTLDGAIGVAEFANANFFSEDTGNRDPSGRSYPFPALDLLRESQLTAPNGTTLRRYYKKGADGGLPIDPLLAECVFDLAALADGLPVPWTYNCVDDNVWRATAEQMVPRAVDYSAGVLEYFFRGHIEIAPPERYVYARAAYQSGNRGAFGKLRFKVRNATPGEASGPGRLVAVVRYRTAVTGANLIETPGEPISDRLYFAVSEPLDSFTLTTDFQEVVMSFSTMPLPTNSADLFLTVAFNGDLGLERGAVMVGGKDLFEPDPLDIGNATDWACGADGDLYYMPDYSGKLDTNNDDRQDLFGPAAASAMFAKAFDVTRPAPIPSDQEFDFQTGQTWFPQYGRLVLLQDQPLYGAALRSPEVRDLRSGITWADNTKTAAVNGVFNETIVEPAGAVIRRRIAWPAVYRGVAMQHMILLTTEQTIPCWSRTWSLQPEMTRIDGSVAPE